MKNIQPILIEGLGNGITVKAGCMKLVYQEDDLHDFFIDLKAYFKDPSGTEKEIRKRWKIESTSTPQPSRMSVTPPDNAESGDSAE